jgi:undecaprenyl-diphosphatase
LDLSQVVFLAILQGLTEFLPISSSAHLILVPKLAGWVDQGLVFDVAVHVGTLTAVVAYFWVDLTKLANAWWHSLWSRHQAPESRVAWGVLLGTVPVGLGGLLLHSVGAEDALRSPLLIAGTTIGFGLLLGWADRQGKQQRSEDSLGWGEILFVGVAQALALIPGTSRSGITLTAGLALGLKRKSAARFSFLLSIPVITLAGFLTTITAWRSAEAVDWTAMIIGTALAGTSAYLCIHYFMQLLEKLGLMPFVLYRQALGVVLLVVFG